MSKSGTSLAAPQQLFCEPNMPLDTYDSAEDQPQERRFNDASQEHQQQAHNAPHAAADDGGKRDKQDLLGGRRAYDKTPGQRDDEGKDANQQSDEESDGKDKSDDKSDDKGGGKDKDGGDDDKPRSKKPLIILAIVIVVVAILGFLWWFLHRNQIETDDAYTDGDVVTMSPKVSGYITELYVTDNSHVKKGDLILRIDPRDYIASQEQARAALALAKAQLESARVAYRIAAIQYPAQLRQAKAQQRSAEAGYAQAEQSYLRQHSVDRRATTQESIDAANSQEVSASANVESAKAQVAVADTVPEQLKSAAATVAQREAQVQQAQAQLDSANLNLSYTEVRAPSDGFITKRNVQLGSYLPVGATMFLIVTPNVWITANFKEGQLGRMRPGDAVDVRVDAYNGLLLHGHVDSIQYGSGSRFSAFPTENATGNYVKIVQRVPVKIVIDSGLDPNAPLPLGLSVSPVVRLP
jgi:membrane fusion protein (multidrug efflux system)